MRTVLFGQIASLRSRGRKRGAAWNEYVEPDLVGVTEFQHLCKKRLSESLGIIDFEESGGNEKYFMGDVASGDFVIYIYQDGAEVEDVKGANRLDAPEFNSPSELIDELLLTIRTKVEMDEQR